MKIIKADSRPTMRASSDYFTGTVWQDPIIEADEPARVRALRVSFDPGARTAWHTHPLGQTLYVISGVGLMGLRNEAPQLIKAGDTVWIPPGEEHWHGASATKFNDAYSYSRSIKWKRCNLVRKSIRWRVFIHRRCLTQLERLLLNASELSQVRLNPKSVFSLIVQF